MSFILLVILVGGGAWIAHAKFNVKWGDIGKTVGTVALVLVSWAFKQEHQRHENASEIVNRMSTYSNEELKNHANNYNNSPRERSAATHEMDRRRENGTGPF